MPLPGSRFDISRSRRLALLTALLTAGGAACLLWAAPGPLLGAAAAALAGWVGARFWTGEVSRSRRDAVIAVGVDLDGCWWVRTRVGGEQRVSLARLFVHPMMVVAVARAAGARHALVIAADAMPVERFRALRSALNVQGMAESRDPDGPR